MRLKQILSVFLIETKNRFTFIVNSRLDFTKESLHKDLTGLKQLFFNQFSPSDLDNWDGNLKTFSDFQPNLSSSKLQIYDTFEEQIW